MVRFQATGAAYEAKNRWWLLSTPKHHADITKIPAPGNKTWTMRIVNCLVSPLKPGAITSISQGAAITPIRTRRATIVARIAPTDHATISASS